METSSGSGSGSGSNDEKRGRKDKKSSPRGSDQRNIGSSGSDTVTKQQMSQKRHTSESPVDPVMFYRASKSFQTDGDRDHSPGTTLASSHNDSRPSVRNTLPRSHSSEQRLSQRHSHVSALHALQNDPEPITPSALDPVLFPEPLRVSRPPSEEYRPYSSDSNTHRASHRPGHERPGTSDSETLSFSYPGRLKANGLRRTESGRETYFPDGVEERRTGVNRGTSGGSQYSGRSGMAARDAGRAY